eukprot:s2756_g4.t4
MQQSLHLMQPREPATKRGKKKVRRRVAKVPSAPPAVPSPPSPVALPGPGRPRGLGTAQTAPAHAPPQQAQVDGSHRCRLWCRFAVLKRCSTSLRDCGNHGIWRQWQRLGRVGLGTADDVVQGLRQGQGLWIEPEMKIWIGNLPEDATWKDLQTLGNTAGATRWVEVFRGKGKGTGMIAYKTAEEERS